MLLVTLVLQASVALAAALAGAFAFRRRSAALRHFLLASGVVVALAAVALPRVAPAWEIDVPAVPALTAPATPPETTLQRSSPASSSAASREAAAPGIPTSSTPSTVSWLRWLAIAWLAGAGIVVARLLVGLAGLRRVDVRAARVRDERLLGALRDVTAELGITRTVTLLFDQAPVGTWGAWRPRVVLPPDAGRWTTSVSAPCSRTSSRTCGASTGRCSWPPKRSVRRACGSTRSPGSSRAGCATKASAPATTSCSAPASSIATTPRTCSTSPAPRAAPCSPPPCRWRVRPRLEGRIAAMLNPTLDRRVPSRVFRSSRAALLLLAASAAAVRVTAQQAGPAALQGVVYDSSGAVLPGVEMALVNEQGVKWSTPTDGAGRFEFAPVGAGKYVLEAVVPGFRTFRQEFVLEREKDWKKNITLQVGELQETIQVTARRPSAGDASASERPASCGWAATSRRRPRAST